MATRTRLTPVQRRDQLLDLGAELFASHPYDEVHIERVAELAGVSRGLLYHYFPSKRDFFVAFLSRENESLLAETAPDPTLPPIEQLRGGVVAFLDHCTAHEHGVRAVFRGAVSSDPAIVDIVARSIDLEVERILTAVDGHANTAPVLVLALRSWIGMVRASCYEFLNDRTIDKQDVATMCIGAFVGAMSGLPAAAVPTGLRRAIADVTGR